MRAEHGPVSWYVDEKVAMLTIAHTPANALGEAVVEGLARSIDDLEATQAKVVVLRSATPGYFAVGADIDHMATIDREGFVSYLRVARAAIGRLAGSPLVSVAAIDGYALGGGLELALACTMRVAGSNAKLGLPEVKLGLIAGAGGTQRLPRLIGRGAALDLLLTGRTVGAQEAHRLGLVDRVAESAEADGLEVAARMAKLSRPALAAVGRCVDAAQSLSFEDGMALEEQEIVSLFCDGEAAEGIAAFLEKRPAVFA